MNRFFVKSLVPFFALFFTSHSMATVVAPFSVKITAIEQTFPIHFPTCYDMGTFSVEKMTGVNPNIFYGIKAEALDKNGEVLSSGFVTESYVPPAPEMVPLILPPGAVAVRTTIFGPESDRVWKNANFELNLADPQLRVSTKDGQVVLDWLRWYGNCWTLERKTDDGWAPSPSTIPAEGPIGLFRLTRNY